MRSGSKVSLRSQKSVKDNDNREEDEEKEEMHALEESSRGKIKGPLLFNYLNSAEKPMLLFLALSLFLLTQILASTADFWVGNW